MAQKGISRNVLLLGIVSFLNDLSSEMILPVLPIFITTLGGSAAVVGLIGGLRESISSLLKVFCGYWSDRTGRRKLFVYSGYLTSSLFKLLLSFSKVWEHVLLFSSLERIGKGIRTAPRDAIIADSMPRRRGKGFGIHRALDTLGAIFGSVLVFLLFWVWFFDFQSIILTAAVIAFISLIPLHFVRDRKTLPREIGFGTGLKGLPGSLRIFIAISGIFAMANFSYMFFLLRAHEFFTGRFAVGVPIMLYILFNTFYAGFSIPFGSLSDRVGRRKVILMGYLLFSLTSLGFIFADAFMFIPLFALYGLVYAMVDGNQRAYVSDLSKPELRSTALGAFHTVTGLAALPGSLLAGFLWEVISPQATFLYGCLMAGVSVILLLCFCGKFRDSS